MSEIDFSEIYLRHYDIDEECAKYKNIKINPNSDWALFMSFDERAFEFDCSINSFVGYGYCMDYKFDNIFRIEYFTKDTTFEQMIERINNGPHYGHFEGIYKSEISEKMLEESFYRSFCKCSMNDFIKKYKNIPFYRLNYGT